MSCFRRYSVFSWLFSHKTAERDIEEYVNYSSEDDEMHYTNDLERGDTEHATSESVEDVAAIVYDGSTHRYNLRKRTPICYREDD